MQNGKRVVQDHRKESQIFAIYRMLYDLKV